MDPFFLSTATDSDYERARLKAFWHDVASHLWRRPNELVSFDRVRKLLRSQASSYGGLQSVPLDRIIGTATNRYHDFDRAFLPAQARTKTRWKSIDRAKIEGVELPPVQLYQIGDLYFVRDGHHRVSVARERGEGFIDAEVIRVQTRVPLTEADRELDSRRLEIIGEYAEFLEQSRLDQILPDASLQFSEPGGYKRLLEHITVHRYYLGLEQKRDVSWEEALKSWYVHVYQPIVEIIANRGILKDFPGRTQADLYLWIMDHHYYLRKQVANAELGSSAEDYASNYSPRWSRKLARGLKRALEELHAPQLPPAPDLTSEGKTAIALSQEEHKTQ